MKRHNIEQMLLEYLGIQKPLIALKPLKEIPATIPPYKGTAYPGLCAQIGEILKEGTTFYITRENNVCYEGLIATGVCDLSRDEYREALEQFIDTCPYHKDMDTAMAFYEENIRVIPVPEVTNACLVVGPLANVEAPDLVIVFCTPLQADIFVRAQAYIGNLTRGFGGLGGCIYNIRYAYVTRQQTFSTSDFPWRVFVGLSPDELTVTIPYERLLESLTVIPRIAVYVKELMQMAHQA
ncbi:MAG: DUF169 domain-containing protein [Desulfobacterota bacterium]|nr:DUF169 domain-containing protein [Thermodesulfobacteriota bacterium]